MWLAGTSDLPVDNAKNGAAGLNLEAVNCRF
jgi:hypothetical protein